MVSITLGMQKTNQSGLKGQMTFLANQIILASFYTEKFYSIGSKYYQLGIFHSTAPIKNGKIGNSSAIHCSWLSTVRATKDFC